MTKIGQSFLSFSPHITCINYMWKKYSVLVHSVGYYYFFFSFLIYWFNFFSICSHTLTCISFQLISFLSFLCRLMYKYLPHFSIMHVDKFSVISSFWQVHETTKMCAINSPQSHKLSICNNWRYKIMFNAEIFIWIETSLHVPKINSHTQEDFMKIQFIGWSFHASFFAVFNGMLACTCVTVYDFPSIPYLRKVHVLVPLNSTLVHVEHFSVFLMQAQLHILAHVLSFLILLMFAVIFNTLNAGSITLMCWHYHS